MGRRFFLALLRLLPGDFRSDFGDAMRADLGRHSAAAVWTREIPGLLAAIAREHAAGLRDDLRYSMRVLLRTPGFTMAAILMLAVGTGVNAAVYSVVDAVLVRPAFPDANRAVEIRKPRPNLPSTRVLPLAAIAELSRAPEFSAVSAVFGRETVTGHNDTPHAMAVDCVSPSMFDVTGVRPTIGRIFTGDESRQNAAVALISYAMWQRDFAGSADVLGRDVVVNNARSRIIGVMPKGFTGAFSIGRTEVWAPIDAAFAGAPTHSCGPVTTAMTVARVNSSLTRGAAASALLPRGFEVLRLEPHVREGYVGPIVAMMGTAVAILLIACANVANLQLGRAERRRRELSVRLALGASRWALVRQSIVENILLMLTGAACGAAAASPLVTMLARMAPRTVPHSTDIAVDARVLLATAAAAILCGIVIGLVPAWRSSRPADLRSSRGVSRSGAMSRTLVTTAIALSVLLVVAAGLMGRTFAALNPTDLGFEPRGRVAAQLNLPAERLANGPSPAVIAALMDDVRRTPGVRGAAISTYQPLRGYPSSARVRVDGRDTPVNAWAGAMEPGFLTTLGASLAAGRDFGAGDTADAPPAAIVNDAFVTRVLGGDPASAIGRVLDVAWDDDTRAMRRIVGVVRTARSGGYDTEARTEIFVPLAQSQLPNYLYIVADADLPADSMKATVLAAARRHFGQPVVEPVESMSALVDTAFARPRFAVWLFGVFASIAVALAVFGLGAVIAWWVSQRTREIGVRVALGADAGLIARLVVGHGLRLAVAGIVIGCGVAMFATRLLSEWLYGVAPNDPLTFVVCSVSMLAMTVIAAYLPARRALRVDPVVALRTE